MYDFRPVQLDLYFIHKWREGTEQSESKIGLVPMITKGEHLVRDFTEYYTFKWPDICSCDRAWLQVIFWENYVLLKRVNPQPFFM